MIVLSGLSGNNQSEIAKYAVKYLLNRKKFLDGAYEIEVNIRKNKQGFLNEVLQSLRLTINTQEDIIQFIKHRQMVLVIPNSDPIFDNDSDNFSKLLKDLLQETTYL